MDKILTYETRILEMPKRFVLKGVKKPFSPGMNQYIRLHWTAQKKARELAKKFMEPHFTNMVPMKYFDWEWYWGHSRFDNDNRQFFWMKMVQDMLKGWKIEEDTSRFINKCTFSQNKGQPEDLIVRIYGEVKL